MIEITMKSTKKTQKVYVSVCIFVTIRTVKKIKLENLRRKGQAEQKIITPSYLDRQHPTSS